MNNPDHISESLETIFGLKYLNSFIRIRDREKKFGSGIFIPDPQHCLNRIFLIKKRAAEYSIERSSSSPVQKVEVLYLNSFIQKVEIFYLSSPVEKVEVLFLNSPVQKVEVLYLSSPVQKVEVLYLTHLYRRLRYSI